ncbi:hypothetical protein [Aliivibrio fischeri]|uniref:Uncharacterized protein n=1 Tax=Aliivibrio fischeri SR5 TaxID=1088719 RepID=A0AAV3EM98_ALIFS|nr:hypothetical protein [Aliivibrio fischeri]EHN67945.1 hypothetical protein VFSR5_2762 [Aliivibrio fischeri SR5]
MEDFAKVVKEYTAWKASINECLINSYDDIVSLVRGSFGQDTFIETVVDNNSTWKVIKKGIIVNADPSGQGYLIWFFHNDNFYLIEKPGKGNNLNITPIFYNNVGIILQSARQLRANSENEVDFLLMLAEWSEVVIPHLKEKMANAPASKVTDRINQLTQAFPSV